MIDVAAFGECLIDFAETGRDENGYPTLLAQPGGAPANLCAAVNACGGSSALIAKVGDDAFGRLLIGTLKKAGINTEGIIVDDSLFTTLAFVTLDEKNDRDFSFARKPGADTGIRFEEVKLSLVDEARVFHFGTLSMTDEPAKSALEQTLAYAKSKGKLISCDPNLRKPLWKDLEKAKEAMLRAVSLADVIKISDDEAEFMFGLAPKEAAAYMVKEMNLPLVFVTCGENGCFFEGKGGRGFVPALKVQVVDTTGAGDVFTGTALCQILQSGKKPSELTTKELTVIAENACRAASLSTTKKGGI